MVCLNTKYVESFRRTKSARHSRGVACWRKYDPAANITKKILNNGVFTYFEYDAANRITDIQNCKSDGTPLCYFAYDYDQASRITRVRREDGTNVYYDYDANNRLTGEHWVDSGNSTIYAFEWDYDSVGNRTYQNAGGIETYYTYDAGNQLNNYHELGSGYGYYTYDNNGNLTVFEEPSGDTTYFEYTDAQLLESAHWPDNSWSYYYYDGLLRRFAISDEYGLNYFTYDQNGIYTLAETDSSGTVRAKYTHGYAPVEGAGSCVQAVIADSGVDYYQYDDTDNLGNFRHILDKNGTEVAHYEFNAFGQFLHKQDPPEGNRRSPFGGSGCIKLKGGFILFLGRLYYSKIGRFVQRDPLGKVVIRENIGIYGNSIFKNEFILQDRFSSDYTFGLLSDYENVRKDSYSIFHTYTIWSNSLNKYANNNPVTEIDIMGLGIFFRKFSTPEEVSLSRAINEIGKKIDDYLKEIKNALKNASCSFSFQGGYFVPNPQPTWEEISSALSHDLIDKFMLKEHFDACELCKALHEISEKLAAIKNHLTHQPLSSYRYARSGHYMCALGADAFTSPILGKNIAFCKSSGISAAYTTHFRQVVAHEGSHAGAGTKDYKYIADRNKRLNDAYAYELLF